MSTALKVERLGKNSGVIVNEHEQGSRGLLQYFYDDEAVRIFVEFTNVGQAIKAFVDLNGRFFGGRSIKASFYDLEAYNSNQFNR
ncbi:unnamed protein product [Thelazia callipaeda]|uniref:RRM domain-containing protein n=1 Tax=Thelazia callipaeda TaxID=103827 RepID=A0A0N5D0N0_THECL|nr:unnamed protein product [Thelazia callipaeda]